MENKDFTSPLEHEKVLMVDIDGTVTVQHEERWGSNEVIPGAVEWVNRKKEEGWTIVFWTGRHPDSYEFTKRFLDNAGFQYDQLICGKPVTMKMVILDDKPMDVIHVERNGGISGVEV